MDDALIRKCMPCFALHSGEKCNPGRIDAYLAECCLVNPATRQPVKKAPLSNVALDAFCECQQEFDLELLGGASNPVASGERNERLDAAVPVLVHVVKDGHITYIQYILFYPYNGATPVLGGVFWAGAHQADLENVTAEVHGSDLKGYYLSRHGDEVFYRTEDLEERDGRRVIYVARGSHANYPSAGSFRRVYGCAYDVTDSHGCTWQPETFTQLFNPGEPEYNPATMGFLRLRGHLGDGLSGGAVLNLPSKSWWSKGHVDADEEPCNLTDTRIYRETVAYARAHPEQHLTV